MIKRMTERATALGVNILFETMGDHIIKENGKVTGVIAKNKDGEEIRISCDAAVICTGGFGANEELVKQKTGYTYDKDFFGFRIPGLVGDGMRMATEVGAATTEINMELAVSVAGEHMSDPLRAAFNQPNLLVNYQGERFFNEEFFENSTFAANAVNIQKGRCGIMVMDEAIKRYYVSHGIDVRSMVLNRENAEGFDHDIVVAIEGGNPYVYMADTLEELAEKAGIKVDVFLKTVDMYNYYCDTYDAQFGKRQDYMKPIVKPPFYACKFFPGAYGTLGGIKVNHYMEVIDPEFDPIPGLYAAGTDTCTIYGDSYMFILPGNTMGYALNSGRMAGENCAEYVKALKRAE